MRDINAHKLINQSMQQRQELLPKISPDDFLTKEQKEKIQKAKENLPLEQKQLLEQILAKPNATVDNTAVVDAIAQMSADQEYFNKAQLANVKLDGLLKLLTPDGRETVLNAMDAQGYSRNNAYDVNQMIDIIKQNLSNPQFQVYLKKNNQDSQLLLQLQQQQQQSQQALQQQMLSLIQQGQQQSMQAMVPPAQTAQPAQTASPSSAQAFLTPSAQPSQPVTPIPFSIPSTPNLGAEYQKADAQYGPSIDDIISKQGNQQAINAIDQFILGEYTDDLNDDKFTQDQSNAIYQYLMDRRAKLENQLGVKTQAPVKPLKGAMRATPKASNSPFKPTPPKAQAQALIDFIPQRKMKEYNTWQEITALSKPEVETALNDRKIQYDVAQTVSSLKSLLWNDVKEKKVQEIEAKLQQKQQAQPAQPVQLTPLKQPTNMGRKDAIYKVLVEAGVQLNPLDSYKLDQLKDIYKREKQLRENP